jgi:hypothetical protein
MHAGVFGEFGMERCRHDSSLPDGDWSVIFAFGGDYFYGCAYALDLGGADEDHFQR